MQKCIFFSTLIKPTNPSIAGLKSLAYDNAFVISRFMWVKNLDVALLGSRFHSSGFNGSTGWSMPGEGVGSTPALEAKGWI